MPEVAASEKPGSTAGWLRSAGQPGDVRDPLAMRMMAIAADAGGDAEALYVGLVALTEVFGTDLGENQAFGETVATHLDDLFEVGVKETVAGVVGG